jgi:hypothetical protein
LVQVEAVVMAVMVQLQLRAVAEVERALLVVLEARAGMAVQELLYWAVLAVLAVLALEPLAQLVSAL